MQFSRTIICLLFVLGPPIYLQQSATQQRIRELLLQSNSDDSSSCSTIADQASRLGPDAIPFLATCWDSSQGSSRFTLVTKVIASLPDSQVYTHLAHAFAIASDSRVRQICAGALFWIAARDHFHKCAHDSAPVSILLILINSLDDTTLTFPNPHAHHLSDLAGAALSLYLGGLMDSIAWPLDSDVNGLSTNQRYSKTKDTVSQWFLQNKHNLRWDAKRCQFTLR